MSISDDLKLQQLFTRKNLSSSRRKAYITTLNELYKLTDKNPSELIKEGKEEEEIYLNEQGLPRVKDIDDRKITAYFFKYYQLLVDKELANQTILGKLRTLRAFYNEYGVELPKPIHIDVQVDVIREGDIPNIDDIRTAVYNSRTLRNKAIILFMASSGIRSGDVRNFKVSDFTKATEKYHGGNSIDDLLDSGIIKHVVPCWDFIPEKTRRLGNRCVTFNTPEATKAIVDYLKLRNNLQEDDYLFLS